MMMFICYCMFNVYFYLDTTQEFMLHPHRHNGFVYTSRYIRHSVSTHGAISCFFFVCLDTFILQGGAFFPSKIPHTSDSMPKITKTLCQRYILYNSVALYFRYMRTNRHSTFIQSDSIPCWTVFFLGEYCVSCICILLRQDIVLCMCVLYVHIYTIQKTI